MKEIYTIVNFYIFIANLGRTVRTAIINQQTFPVCECLGNNAVNTTTEIFLSIVNWDYDGD